MGTYLPTSSLENIKELLGKCERGKKLHPFGTRPERSDCDHNTNPFSAL